MKLKAQCLKVMYSRNLLNEEFRDGFLIYNDIFAIHTKYVCVHGVTMRKWKQYIGNAAEMTRFEKMPRVHNRISEG